MCIISNKRMWSQMHSHAFSKKPWKHFRWQLLAFNKQSGNRSAKCMLAKALLQTYSNAIGSHLDAKNFWGRSWMIYVALECCKKGLLYSSDSLQYQMTFLRLSITWNDNTSSYPRKLTAAEKFQGDPVSAYSRSVLWPVSLRFI